MQERSGILSHFTVRVLWANISTVLVTFLLFGCAPFVSDRLGLVGSPQLVIQLFCSYLLLVNSILSVYKKVGEATNRFNSLRVKVCNAVRVAGQLVLTACVAHAVLVLFGAPLTQSISETFHLACLLTSTAVLPCVCIISPSPAQWAHCWSTNSNRLECCIIINSVSSLVGAWLGAFPIPLDWDRPWQVWPVSCVIGCLVGYNCSLAGTSLYLLRQSPTDKTKSV